MVALIIISRLCLIYVTGGTVELFKLEGLNFEKGNIKVMDNPIYSNVLGALKAVGGAE